MGKEVKISLAAVGVLVIILIAVLGRSLLRSGDAPPADDEKAIAAADTKASDNQSDGGSKGEEKSSPGSFKGPDFVTLEKPKSVPVGLSGASLAPSLPSGRGVPSTFHVVADETSQRGAARSSPPTFMPKPPEPVAGSPRAPEPGRASTHNPFPMVQRSPASAEPGTAGAEASPRSAGGALDPYRRYGSEAGVSGSADQERTPAYDDRSTPYRDSTASPPAYDSSASQGGGSGYRTSEGSGYQTSEDSGYGTSGHAGSGGARFEPTSSRSGPSSYSTASSSPAPGNRFSLPDAAPQPVEDGKYTVQPNDSFWKISERLYGTGVYFNALAEHNRRVCPNPHRLRAGTVIEVPDESVLRERFPTLCPSAEKEKTRRHRESVGSAGYAPSNGRVYLVQAGDTLYDIARYELEDASRWGEIVALNRDQLGNDYDYLTPGMKLVLPTDRAESFQPAQRFSQPSIRTATPPRSEAYRRY